MLLTPYVNNNDTSILWTERDVNDKDGYKNIVTTLSSGRPMWHPSANIVREGNNLESYSTSNVKGDLLWKMIPLESLVRIQSKLDSSFFLSLRNNRVVLATSNASDESQQWYIHKSADGLSFVVVNKKTGQAIQQPQPYEALELVSNFSMEDVTLKWTEYEVNKADGSTAIKMANHFTQVWDVEKSAANDGTPIFSWKSGGQKNKPALDHYTNRDLKTRMLFCCLLSIKMLRISVKMMFFSGSVI